MILEQMIEETLGYIEKESAYWDEEKLKTGDLDFTFQYIMEAVGKALFLHMHKDMEGLPEELLKEQSIYFYFDCIQRSYVEFISDTGKEGKKEITYKQFYDLFIQFIKEIRKMNVDESMEPELKQLYDMLSCVHFTAGDDSGYREDEKAVSKCRYVFGDRNDEDVSPLDVVRATKRFWTKWIVGENARKANQEILSRKNMDEREAPFWIILASIVNFADSFGDDTLKELKSMLNYTHNTEEKNISEALNWCFRCWYGMIRRCEGWLFDFISKTDGIYGMSQLADRFEYQVFVAKRQLRKELEEIFQAPNKIFTTRHANDVVFQIELDSLHSGMPLTGEITSGGLISTDDRKLVKYFRYIWADFEKQCLDRREYMKKILKEEGDISQVDLEIHSQNMQVNKFFADEFVRLFYLESEYPKLANLFVAEFHLFFSQLDDLMYQNEMTLEEICFGIVVLARLCEGEEIDEIMDGWEEDDEDFETDIGYRLWEKQEELLKFYKGIFDKEMDYLCLYCQIVENIVMKRKNIRISEKLFRKLYPEKGKDKFYKDGTDRISWKDISQDIVNEHFIWSLSNEVIDSYTLELEYND